MPRGEGRSSDDREQLPTHVALGVIKPQESTGDLEDIHIYIYIYRFLNEKFPSITLQRVNHNVSPISIIQVDPVVFLAN